MNVIPILLYHGITRNASKRMAPFAVTPDDFKRHLDALVTRGFRCLTVSEFIDQRSNLASDAKIALVTFDDGYADFVEIALPALQERNIASTMYVTTGWLDGGSSESTVRPEDAFMSWTDVVDLDSAGVELGAHSHTHPQLDTLDNAGVIYELTRSKALVEDAIGQTVRSFAYPHGYNGPRVRRLTSEAGYDSATAVRNMLSTQTDDRFALARLMLLDNTTLADVEEWLDGKGPVADHSESAATRGWRAYRRMKAIATGKPGTDYA